MGRLTSASKSSPTTILALLFRRKTLWLGDRFVLETKPGVSPQSLLNSAEVSPKCGSDNVHVIIVDRVSQSVARRNRRL